MISSLRMCTCRNTGDTAGRVARPGGSPPWWGDTGGSMGTGQGMLQGPAGPCKPGSVELQEGKMLTWILV